MNFVSMTAKEIGDGLRKKAFSAREIATASLGQIEKLNSKVNAFITVNDKALARADAIDAKIAKGEDPGLLAGVPVAIKDQLCTKGILTTAGSKMLTGFKPPYDATVVERLENNGAINVGKTNQDEFAMGSSTETSSYGISRNPWNLDYVPGGSSGGSAAAVAARMAPVAVGTDTGGSIRQPANFCGIVGIKPTYGRVSRYGIIAFASSLDQAGPMTRTVEDAAIALEAMAGHDERDSTCAQVAVPQWSKNISKNLKGLKVGLPKEYFSDVLTAETRQAVEKAIDAVRKAGGETVEVSLPLTEMAVPIYYLVATSEASSNLARYDGVRYGYRADFSKKSAEDIAEFYCRSRGEGFGAEVKRRIILGTYALSSGYYDAYYKKASQVRRLLRQQFLDTFKECQLIMSPVTTSPAFKIGDRIDDPLAMYLNDLYTTSANLCGLPGISVPAGLSKAGLPIGVQFLGAHFDEQRLFNAASVVEEALPLKELPNGI